ncbi:MAG: SGNH/GDSL hydrolase family protein [Gemmatimonadota bacterium]|nr:SGNH/GDSL hydrolase family protein [Gemmatimonadota bacterium]
MARVRNKKTLVTGVVLLAAGIILNKWVVAAMLVPDGSISSPVVNHAILLFQVVLAAAGLFLAIRQPSLRVSRTQIVLLAASTIITLASVELGARLWLNHMAAPEEFYNYSLYTDIEQFNYAPHHYLNYYPTPDYQKGSTFHNSLGYRNREFPIKKPEGTCRIAVLGGSTTYETGVEDNSRIFTVQLESVLNRDYGCRVEVINAGASGYTSWETLLNLVFRVLDLEPDLVIIYQGFNDVYVRLMKPGAYLADNSGYRKQWTPPPVPVWEHSCMLRIISRRLGLTNPTALYFFVKRMENRSDDWLDALERNPPVYFRRNLNNIVALARANDVRIMLSTFAHTPLYATYTAPAYLKGLEEHNEIIARVAEEKEIPLFDFASVMPSDSVYWTDGIHHSEQGARLKAGLFARFIVEGGLTGEGSAQ